MKKNRKIEFWIMTSYEDIASTNIRRYLLENFSFEKSIDTIDTIDTEKIWNIWDGNETFKLDSETSDFTIRLVTTDKRMAFFDKDISDSELQEEIGADFLIFASRHRAQSNKPALLTHTTGIWNDDIEFGDNARTVSKSSAMLLRTAYEKLIEHNQSNNLNWSIDLEVNHHGPTKIPCPSIFMELGSTIENWNNIIAIKTVSQAIIDTITTYMDYIFSYFNLSTYLESSMKPDSRNLKDFIQKQILKATENSIPKELFCLGFGGPHYASNFSMIYSINKSVFFSHIVPKYFILDLTKEQIQMMIDNTLEPVNAFVIDWRGINSEAKTYLVDLLRNFDIPIIKTKELRTII